jgi:hypothetical protein
MGHVCFVPNEVKATSCFPVVGGKSLGSDATCLLRSLHLKVPLCHNLSVRVRDSQINPGTFKFEIGFRHDHQTGSAETTCHPKAPFLSSCCWLVETLFYESPGRWGKEPV